MVISGLVETCVTHLLQLVLSCFLVSLSFASGCVGRFSLMLFSIFDGISEREESAFNDFSGSYNRDTVPLELIQLPGCDDVASFQ